MQWKVQNGQSLIVKHMATKNSEVWWVEKNKYPQNICKPTRGIEIESDGRKTVRIQCRNCQVLASWRRTKPMEICHYKEHK